MEETKKEYKDERFEFTLWINNNLICKRNFKINNYINESMQSIDFKNTVDAITEMINDDLKSKSRVYTWYMTDDEGNSMVHEDLLEPWECTFKFVVTDNKVPVIEKIWDGWGFQKAILDKVDIANKNVRITTYGGQTYTYDKETYFKENADRLTPEMYITRAMIIDKPDLLLAITKKICEVCSPRENGYQTTSDYVLSETYVDRSFERDEEGNIKMSSKGKPLTQINKANNHKYFYSRNLEYNKFVAEWGKAVSAKTKEYINTLYK